MKKSLTLTALALSSTLWLGACGANNDESNSDSHDMSHGDMMHSSDGKLPSGLKEANNPTYPKGSNVTLTTNHMDGMNGAKATIAGAYDTVVYAISYKPTDGGKMVENHKWVIQEELDPVPTKPLQVGDETTVKADHMKGMDGAKATIDEVKETTVYMVDYTPTDGGDPVKNHKWVTEDELKK